MLTVFGLIISVIAAMNVYRIAGKNRRKAALWAVIVFVTGVLLEVVIPFLLVLISGFVLLSSGNSINKAGKMMKNPVVVIDTICLVFNIIGILVITYFVARAPKEKPFTTPPQPPEFN
jgi:hypothetical protein